MPYTTKLNSLLKWPLSSKNRFSTLYRKILHWFTQHLLCVLCARDCVMNWETKRSHPCPCWVHSLEETGMNWYLSQHGKCNHSGWLTEQRGQNGGRWSNSHGSDKRMSGKRRKWSSGLLKERERFFPGKEDKGYFSMEDPTCTKAETKAEWLSQATGRMQGSIRLLRTCIPAANARWSHFTPIATYLRRPSLHHQSYFMSLVLYTLPLS